METKTCYVNHNEYKLNRKNNKSQFHFLLFESCFQRINPYESNTFLFIDTMRNFRSAEFSHFYPPLGHFMEKFRVPLSFIYLYEPFVVPRMGLYHYNDIIIKYKIRAWLAFFVCYTISVHLTFSVPQKILCVVQMRVATAAFWSCRNKSSFILLVILYTSNECHI